MREPKRIYAKAGQYQRLSRPRVLRTFDDIRIMLAKSYYPTATDEREIFLDLSQYDDVDLDIVAAYRNPQIRGVMIRIGGSASVKDPKFPLYWPWAKRVGLLRHIYTYNWPGWPVDLHIQNFMGSVEEYCQGDLGEGNIELDAECDAGKSKREVTDHIFDYAELLTQETEKETDIYSGPWFINGFMEFQERLKKFFWWMATWMWPDQPFEHPGPPNTVDWIPLNKIKWQQTGSNCREDVFGGSVNGRVDTNRWNLGEAAFIKEYGAEPPTPPQPGGLEEQVLKNTADIVSLYERVNILNEWIRSYDD